MSNSSVPVSIPGQMAAVQLLGHGGIEQLQYREDVAVPEVGPDDVLIKVAAAGVNNTDINTRIGWYSKQVTEATNEGGAGGFQSVNDADATWSGSALEFPRIQGADCCGRIVATGASVSAGRLGERVLVRSMMRAYGDKSGFECTVFGSECDGGFAQYVRIHGDEAYAIDCDLTDVELAAVPCAFSTAEGLLHRAGVGPERVLITGASGGVGSAAVQLAKRRGAEVVAICSQSKAETVLGLGADSVIDRGADLVDALGENSIDVVLDLVAGDQWSALLDVLRLGGRYAVAGAIAGPMVNFDVRTLYLKDLSFFGCTFQEDVVFENIIKYLEDGEIKPLIAKTFPLHDIGAAQEAFLAKQFVGKLVLIPPQ